MTDNKAFSLLEVVVVLAIISIMAAVAAPNYNSWLAGHRLSASARDIYSLIQLSRLRAVKERANVCIEINAGSGHCYAYVDNGPKETIQETTVEKGITITGVTASHVEFNSRGFPKPFGTSITLMNINGDQKQIRLSMAGHVRIL